MRLLHILALVSFVKSETFKIGFLSGNRQRNGKPNSALPGIRISPAIKVAIDEINRNSYLPYNHSLDYITAETYGEENESILQTAALWRENISAYIGPQETCMYEAKLASSLNLPMISHFCTHPEPSNKVSTLNLKIVQKCLIILKIENLLKIHPKKSHFTKLRTKRAKYTFKVFEFLRQKSTFESIDAIFIIFARKFKYF